MVTELAMCIFIMLLFSFLYVYFNALDELAPPVSRCC